MIEFRNVVLQYHYDEFALLKGVNFTLRDGINTVLADIQSGKSSICKLLMKEVAANSGEILVDGLTIGSITSADLGILYLPSKPTFFENKSIRFNIEYPLKVRKVAKNERRERAEQVAASLGLDNLDAKVKMLTAEERKLVALARGLTVERKIVLFDDFFEICDDGTKTLACVDSMIDKFNNATCVILSSDKRLAIGNTVVLDGGVTVYEGNADRARGVIDSLDWLNGSLKE
ncbi:MAG: ATP-binding cassette domain-containing protein [Clostridiales bacterium]|nr:ATP-binding cassette domain-containing protein [Clostridiales bacterium]